MDTTPALENPELSALASLRRFARPRAPLECCDLCGARLPEEHGHLLERATGKLHCACEPCSILFDTQGVARFRRVPRRIQILDGFRLSDETWAALGLPINLAFFVRSTPSGGVMALYPSPAGATAAAVDEDEEGWRRLTDDNPSLRTLEPDVEALLIHRVGDAREAYRVGIDECYRLSGLIRVHWRGLSGGQAAWAEIARFFDDLKRRGAHA
jgi:hypothetical protein